MCPAYTTAKQHDGQGLTKCMAIDFRAAKIRASASVDTAMVSKFWEAGEPAEVVKSFMTVRHLGKRLGYPEEVAKLVCFLASDEASFINGAAYLIDAGESRLAGGRVAAGDLAGGCGAAAPLPRGRGVALANQTTVRWKAGGAAHEHEEATWSIAMRWSNCSARSG